jgi:hypothetical protein
VLAQSSDGFAVVGVVVSEHDAAEATARVDRREESLYVGAGQGAGVHDIGRIAAHDPRVCARQRQRAGIIRAQTQNTVPGQPASLGGEVSRIRQATF